MSQLLPYLFLLVCPLTMGVMMWVMMRGMGQGHPPDPRVAELESQVNELRSAAATGRPSPPAPKPLDPFEVESRQPAAEQPGRSY